MAMNLYRHWVGQHICADMARYAEDEGFAFYHAVATGGDAYLPGSSVEGFSQFFPLSSKARRSFELQMGFMKEGVKHYVANLVRNRSSLDTKSFAIAHLTCVKVEKHEMPWLDGSGKGKNKRVHEESDEEDEEGTAPSGGGGGFGGGRGGLPWEGSDVGDEEDDDKDETEDEDAKESAVEAMEDE